MKINITTHNFINDDYYLLVEDTVQIALDVGTPEDLILAAEFMTNYIERGYQAERDVEHLYDRLLLKKVTEHPYPPNEAVDKILARLMALSRNMALENPKPD